MSAVLDLAAEAVFASHLQPSEHPGRAAVDDAVHATILRLGTGGVAAAVAVEFGDHPDRAVARMRWARIMARRAVAQPYAARAVTR